PSPQPIGHGQIAYATEELRVLLDPIADVHLHRRLPPCRERQQKKLVVAAQAQRPLRLHHAGREAGEEHPDGTKLGKSWGACLATPGKAPRIRIDELLPECHSLVVTFAWPRARRGEVRLNGILGGLIEHGVIALERLRAGSCARARWTRRNVDD